MKQIDAVIVTADCYMTAIPGDWYVEQLIQEDNYVVSAFQELGMSAIRQAWDRPNFDWTIAKIVLLRTTWNYSQKFPEFLAWLQQVSQTCHVFNPIEVIRWNIEKTYLQDLKKQGVHVVDTIYADCSTELEDTMNINKWDDLIIKPVVSGGAFHTYRIHHDNLHQYQSLWKQLRNERKMMIQPFQKEILEQGEISCIVIGGKFSHAIRKIPKKGDFRVQDEHGGRVIPYVPNEEEIYFAEQAIAVARYPICYARVDFIRDNENRLAIMELELIEPELFFRFRPEASMELASACTRP